MARLDQVNTLLKKIISEAITEHVQVLDVLVTVTYVDLSPNLKNANVGVSFLPKNLAGTGLAELKRNTHAIVREVSKRSELRVMPKFRWAVDETEEKLEEMDRLYEMIKQERNE